MFATKGLKFALGIIIMPNNSQNDVRNLVIVLVLVIINISEREYNRGYNRE